MSIYSNQQSDGEAMFTRKRSSTQNRCLGRYLLAGVVLVLSVVLAGTSAFGQSKAGGEAANLIDIGIATIDITPEGPIRLSGYAAREKSESKGILHRLHAKALAIGNDAQGPVILITADLLGIPGHITDKVADQLSRKAGIARAKFAIATSHTHGGPDLGLINILQSRGKAFSDSLLSLDHLAHIADYVHHLTRKLEEVALAALENRRPSLLSWDQAQARFGKNRRTEGGPVDPALALLRVADPDGKLRAVLVNYACHGTTLGGDVNQIHGDWISEAQLQIEARHPGTVAMVAVGCGGDINPNPRGKVEHMKQHGAQIATNVDRLLSSPLRPLTSPPVAAMKWVSLPFSHVPDIPELIEQTQEQSVKGYYARIALERVLRGHPIASEVNYPVQVWAFGKEMAMVNLGGEVVVDYSVRLKNELGAEKLWINAYTNDVACYIASRRVIGEGGYEAESSMYWYDKPSPFKPEVEDIIVSAVYDLMPTSFKEERPETNTPKVIEAGPGDVIHLNAETAHAIGPEIKYMPEWKAFGWFTPADRAEWDVVVNKKGKYDVYLEWSVSDAGSGKGYVVEAGKKRLTGVIAKTGSWFTYRTEKIGTLDLQAGQQKIAFKGLSPDKEKGYMIDLRGLTLKRR